MVPALCLLTEPRNKRTVPETVTRLNRLVKPSPSARLNVAHSNLKFKCAIVLIPDHAFESKLDNNKHSKAFRN